MPLAMRAHLSWLMLLPALLGPPAAAHEYWIAPEDFTPAPGEPVAVRLLVGEMMKGAELPWLSHQVASFHAVTGGEAEPLEGMEGDLPAVTYTPQEPGLHILAHRTQPLTVTFDTLAEFEEYLAYEGLAQVVELHRGRGLPEENVTEAYERSAKALLQVGPVRAGDGDRALGLPFEIVALANPYAGGKVLPVRLLWQGEPEAGAQISVFRDDGEVERILVRTDADGRAEIPLVEGGSYVLNAVHVEPVEGEGHVWASTWASLSFAVDAAD